MKSRQILPITYNAGKKKRAQNFATEFDCGNGNIPESVDIDPSIQENKENIRKEIDAKMKSIHDMFFDLSDDEIDAIQEAIENDDDDDIDVDLFHNIINDVISEENENENTDSNHANESMESNSSGQSSIINSNEEIGSNDNDFSGL